MPVSRGCSRSVHRELLLSVVALFAGGILLAVAALAVVLPLLDSAVRAAIVVAVIVAADIGIVFFFLRSLLRRTVFDPLERIGEHAEAIAGGEYGNRIPQENGEEVDRLVRSVNTMAQRLIADQETLAENVRSLDRTNRELVDTTEELVRSARMASVGTLAAGLAHEVGNPLGALRGYLDVARRRSGNGGDLETPLDAAVDEARRIDRIVRSVLDFAGSNGDTGSNGDEGPVGSTAERVSVGETVTRTLTLLEGRGALEGITVEWWEGPEEHHARVRPQPMEQVLLNLLMNAVHAVKDGAHPRIRVRLATERISEPRLRARRAGDPRGVDYSHRRRIPLLVSGESARRATVPDGVARDVVLRVEDNGPGIDPDHLSRIFDPFFTTRPPGEGTGLGLAVTARLVQAVGGRIVAENREEGGARFTVRLPEWTEEPSHAEDER